MSIRFDGRVAIVTGAGNGLGRCHALGLAARGAKVLVNDIGQEGRAPEAAAKVVDEIRSLGGEALADGADVTRPEQVAVAVDRARKEWGRVDILVNNAGILRDKTFAKMDLSDFELVMKVHVMGSVNFTKAVWPVMREQSYGRIVFTSSGSGIYGNFGQANYAAAKTSFIGLMNVLHQEGAKHNIKINTLVPTAATAMTWDLISPEAAALLRPETVTPAVLFLTAEAAPSRTILAAGAGVYSVIHVVESNGVFLAEHERTPETIEARFAEISDQSRASGRVGAFEQTCLFVQIAAAAQGLPIPPVERPHA